MDKNKKGRYPYAADTGCYIYHYGHVRKTSCNQLKDRQVSKYWGEQDKKLFENYGNIDFRELRKFTGTHPAIIKDWLVNEAEKDFKHNPEYKITLKDRKHRIRFWLLESLGIDISHKHYFKAKI